MRLEINRAKWKKINANINVNNNYNNDYSNQNYTEKNNINQQGYSEKDNFRHEKNGKEREYNGSKKTTFNSSDDLIRELEEKIDRHRNELLQTSSDEKRKYLQETIWILEKEIEKLKNNVNSNNEQDKDSEKNKLSAYREMVRNSIQEALNTDPKITNNDLESSFQNWENKLTGLDDKTAISDFQTSLLLHIEKIRETKQEEQENAQNFNKFNNPNATEEEKEEEWRARILWEG